MAINIRNAARKEVRTKYLVITSSAEIYQLPLFRQKCMQATITISVSREKDRKIS